MQLLVCKLVASEASTIFVMLILMSNYWCEGSVALLKKNRPTAGLKITCKKLYTLKKKAFHYFCLFDWLLRLTK
jgi:hypothetical protein